MARLTAAEAEEKLKPLLAEIDRNAWEIGRILAESFLTDAELLKLAERLGVSLATLEECRRTVVVLREPIEGTSFAIMAELSRIADTQFREEVWDSRPPQEWTLLNLRTAVTAKLRQIRQSPATPRSRNAVAVENEGRRVKAVVTVTADAVIVDLDTNSELDFTRVEISRDGDSWHHVYPWAEGKE